MAEKRIQKQENKNRSSHHAWGWVEWTRRSEVFLCDCGTKYLKTRKGQNACLRCSRRV